METRIRERLHDLAGDAPKGTVVPASLVPRARRRILLTASVSACVVGLLGLAAFAGVRSIVNGATKPATTPTPPPAASSAPPRAVQLVDASFVELRTGDATPLPESLRSIPGARDFQVSPDGSMVAFTATGSHLYSQIHVANVDGTEIRQLTSDPDGHESFPVWSPDGTEIAYVTDIGFGGGSRLSVVDAATGETRSLLQVSRIDVDLEIWQPSFSVDGRTILFTRKERGSIDLWTVLASGGKPTLLLQHAAYGSYSPDGRTIAYRRAAKSPVMGVFCDPCPEVEGSVSLATADGEALPGSREVGGAELPDGGVTELNRLQWSADGTTVLFTNATERGARSSISLFDVLSGDITEIGRGLIPSWFDDDTLIVSEWSRVA